MVAVSGMGESVAGKVNYVPGSFGISIITMTIHLMIAMRVLFQHLNESQSDKGSQYRFLRRESVFSSAFGKFEIVFSRPVQELIVSSQPS